MTREAGVKGGAAGADDAPMEEAAVDIDQVILFDLADQRYALPISEVQEIQQLVQPTGLPGTAPSLLGVIDLRGEVVPVIDLRLVLGMDEASYGLQTPMVVVRTGSRLAALVVDEVEDVVDVPPESMRAPSGVHELADRMLGVCRFPDGLVFVLDLERVVPETQVAEVAALVEG